MTDKKLSDELYNEVMAEVKASLKAKAAQTLKTIMNGQSACKKWIDTRQKQIAELDVLRNELFAAYEAGDESLLDTIQTKVNELNNRGCK